MNQRIKPIVIYHANCVDGFGGAWCFWKFGKMNSIDFEFYPGKYQKAPPDVTGREVYLVDFSYKRPVMEEILKQAAHVTIIDHHKSAIEDLKDLEAPNFVKYFSSIRSGATLAWDFLYPTRPRPPLLEHIEDRDLWKFGLPFTREIQAALFAEDQDFEIWDEIISNGKPALIKLTAAGMAINKKHSKDVKTLIEVCTRPMIIGGYEVPAASIPFMFVSDAGHMMAKGHPFAACYYDTCNHRDFSLRSDSNGIDVSVIAAMYGGGGHFHASGFKVTRDHELAKA